MVKAAICDHDEQMGQPFHMLCIEEIRGWMVEKPWRKKVS